MERCNKKRISTSMRTKNGAVFHKRTAPPFLRIADIFDDILHSFLILGVLLHVFDHLAGCVDDGGVVAPAKLVADGSHRHLGDLTDDVHGDLPRVGDLGGALGRADILRANPEGASHLRDDPLDGDRNRLVVGEDFADGALREQDGGRGLRQLVVGVELFDHPF